MPRYHADLAARAVPRYTSYPTALDFSAEVGAEQQALALSGIVRDTPISLYVHIPYCHEICWYCGCNTGAVGRASRLDDYLDALLAEMAIVGALCDGTVHSVHFGGGSPNVLTPEQLNRLTGAIRERFAVDDTAEWAMEIDPRGFRVDHAVALAAMGISRVSIGVQTFSAPIQRAINRVQSYDTVASVVALLRAVGIRDINLDLMYGLPDQQEDDITATLAAALTLRPSRVAMFGYAHVPAMIPRQRMIDAKRLPDAGERFRQSALAQRLMVEAGYCAIGFDHFARPCDRLARAAATGRLRRNFQGFTDDPAEEVIGLGASAISQFEGVIVQNEKHVGRYRTAVRSRRLAGVRGVVRDGEDRLRAAIIERLLCDGCVDLEAVCAQYHLAPSLLVEAFVALAPLEERGVVSWSGSRLIVPDDDRCYRRLVATAFDLRSRRKPREATLAV